MQTSDSLNFKVGDWVRQVENIYSTEYPLVEVIKIEAYGDYEINVTHRHKGCGMTNNYTATIDNLNKAFIPINMKRCKDIEEALFKAKYENI